MPPKAAVASLLFAVFAVSLGYGTLLPVLPSTIGRLSADPAMAAVIHHTGIVTAAYAGAAFIVAPISGWFADRGPTRWLIVTALSLGAAVTVLAGLARSLPELYALRLAAGAAAGAVGPAVQAWFGRWDMAWPDWRTRRLVWVAIAATSGFFAGPLVGSMVASAGPNGSFFAVPREGLPFAVSAVVQAFAALSVAMTVRKAPARIAVSARDPPRRYIDFVAPILQLSVTSLAVSAFEVGLAFPAKGKEADPMAIGLLFALCSLVMILVQLVFAAGLIRARQWSRYKQPAILFLAAGLAGMAWASAFAPHFVAVVFVAAGGGAIPLILARELAATAGPATGTAGGLASSAGLAGQTGGALLASLVVALSGKPENVFLAAAATVALVSVLISPREAAGSGPYPGSG
jgi:MFS family permease